MDAGPSFAEPERTSSPELRWTGSAELRWTSFAGLACTWLAEPRGLYVPEPGTVLERAPVPCPGTHSVKLSADPRPRVHAASGP